MVIPFGIIASCFLLTTIFVADKEMSGETLFGVTVLLVFITGSVTAWGNGGVVAVAANFPPVYISAVYQGQALAGLLISSLELITVAANKNEISCTDDDGEEDCSYDSVSYR